MTSYPSSPAPDRLTTEQLLAEAVHATGYIPTWRQLRYWVRNGLLAEPQQRALGRGRGSVTLWDPATLPRLTLILRARTGSKGRNIELQSARLLMTLKGYAPADTRQLRAVFETYVAAFDTLTVRQQQERQQAALELREMIEHPATKREARILDTMPDRGGVMYSFLPFFVPDRNATDPWQRLGWYFSPPGLRATLEAINDEHLYVAYFQAGLLLDTGLIPTSPLSQFALPMSQFNLPPLILGEIPAGVELTDADMRRLPTTLALLQTALCGPQIAEAWEDAAKQLAPLAHEMAQRLSQSPDTEGDITGSFGS